MVTGRRKSIAFVITLGAGLVLVILLLYVGWVILDWRTGILLFLGVLMLAMIISGVVINTIFLVREIRRNEQHNAFINAVTHELKTPVASIRLYLQTLQKHELPVDKRNEFYRIMLDDSDRLLSTIEQVLRTGRLASTRRGLAVSPIDLGSLVEDCLARARTLQTSGARSLRFAGGQRITVVGDPDDVQAAVSNLIDNAVKYSGSDVEVSVEPPEAGGKYVSVRVKDQGPGIPKSELNRIFKRFYRIPGPLATRVKGTGLGLFIVRSVAKRHGGRVWAESEGPGRGSTFVLQFPVAQ